MGYDTSLYVALAVVLAFVVGVIVYVAGSFALMRRHTAERPWADAVRALAAEIAWALLSQPLLPLFYFVGRRLDGRGAVPVVLVHGYMQNRVDFIRIAFALRASGAGPLYGINYPWFARVDGNAKRLARFIDDVCRERGVDHVDLVCHSLGGVVATEYLRENGGRRVRKCVTIASPHAGIAWKGPIPGACADELRAGTPAVRTRARHSLPVPCLSIYSTHDNVVHPPATSTLVERGGRDRIIDGKPHLAILFARETADAVVDFLCAPEPVATAITAAATP
jgi:pimeloyl-ACP methyl ester carboxylesterase